MALTIVVRSGDVEAPPSITFESPRLVIGRGDGCDVRLPDPSVSHRHASIRQRGAEHIIVDEGSTNGTYVGPVRLAPHAPRVVKSGDLVRIGRIWLELRVEAGMPTQNPNVATKEVALALVAGALSAQGDPSDLRVFVSKGPDAGRELVLVEFERPYVVGRGARVDLSLDDPDASRRHVELVRRGNQLIVHDLGSKNGSHLGERQLAPKSEERWPREVPLVIGANELLYDDPLSEALAELESVADEHMPEDESVDPPTGMEPSPSAPPAKAEEAPSAAARNQAPIATVPRRGAKRAPSKRGFDGTDLVVALLALLVLGLSILGLWWLFKSA